MKKYNITLVSFYTKDLKNAYRRFLKHGMHTDLFTNYYILGEEELENNTKYISNNKDLIDNSFIGFGYYLFKPYLIESVFNKFPTSDYFFYLDIGTEFNINKKTIDRFYEYIDIAKKDNIFGFKNRDLEKNLTHCSVINNIYPNANKDRQFNSGTIIFKNNNFSLNFVKEWKDECMKNNYYNISPTNKVFCCNDWSGINMYEQSVLSCLLKKYKIEGISDEADWYLPNYSIYNSISDNRNKYPIFSARNPFLKSILYKECIKYREFTTCKHKMGCSNTITVRK